MMERANSPVTFLSPVLLPLLVFSFLTGCFNQTPKTDLEIEQALEQGLDFIEMYDLARARRVLAPAYNSISPDHPAFDRIAYTFSIALWHDSPTRAAFVRQAEEILRGLISTAQTPGIRRLAKLDLARILEISDFSGDLVDVSGARALYREIYAENNGDNLGKTALIYLANSYAKELIDAEAPKKGIDLLADHLSRYSSGPMASLMWQLKGNIHADSFGDVEAALGAYLRALELGFVDIPRTDTFLWTMSEWALQISDYDLAVDLMTRIVKDTPRSLLTTYARLRIKELNDRFPEKRYPIPELQAIGMSLR